MPWLPHLCIQGLCRPYTRSRRGSVLMSTQASSEEKEAPKCRLLLLPFLLPKEAGVKKRKLKWANEKRGEMRQRV